MGLLDEKTLINIIGTLDLKLPADTINKIKNNIEVATKKLRDIPVGTKGLKEAHKYTQLMRDHVKQLEAGFTNAIKPAQSLVHTMGLAVKKAFSWNKIMNRIAFVITAKLSYELFDRIQKAISSIVTTTIKLQEELAKVWTLLDVGQEKFKELLTKETIDLMMKYGSAMDDTSRALYDILSARIPVGSAMYVLEESQKAAIGGFTDLRTAADAITTTLNSFNLEASRAGDVSDWLFTIIKYGKTTMAELAPNLGKVTASAHLLGISMEEVGTSLATMTQIGLDTDVAITSLRQLMITLAAPTDKAKEIFKKYNLQLDLATIRQNGLAYAVRQLVGLSEDEIVTIAKSRRGFMALASALGNNIRYTENYNHMLNRAGVAQRAFEERASTLHFQLKKLGKTIMMFGIMLGKILFPALELVVGLMNKFTRGLYEMGKFISEHTSLQIIILTVLIIKLASAFRIAAVAVMAFLTASTGGVWKIITLSLVALSFAIGFLVDKETELKDVTNDATSELELMRNEVELIANATIEAVKKIDKLIEKFKEMTTEELTDYYYELEESIGNVKNAIISLAREGIAPSAYFFQSLSEDIETQGKILEVLIKRIKTFSDTEIELNKKNQTSNEIYQTLYISLIEKRIKWIAEWAKNNEEAYIKNIDLQNEYLKLLKILNKTEKEIIEPLIDELAIRRKLEDLRVRSTEDSIDDLELKRDRELEVADELFKNWFENIEARAHINKYYDNLILSIKEKIIEAEIKGIIKIQKLRGEDLRMFLENEKKKAIAVGDTIRAGVIDKMIAMLAIGDSAFKRFVDGVQTHVTQMVNNIAAMWETLVQISLDKNQRLLDNDLERIDAQSEAELGRLSEQEVAEIAYAESIGLKTDVIRDKYAKRKQVAEDKATKLRESAEKEAAAQAKALRKAMQPIMIAQAIANTALAVTGVLADIKSIPVTWVRIALASTIGALGAAKVAMIAAQKFARGGVVNLGKAASGMVHYAGAKFAMIGGKSHAAGGTEFVGSDGTRFTAERNELLAIMNKRSVGLLRKFSDWNIFGGGVPLMAGGGLPSMQAGGSIHIPNYGGDPYLNGADNMALLISEMKNIAVSIKEIEWTLEIDNRQAGNIVNKGKDFNRKTDL